MFLNNASPGFRYETPASVASQSIPSSDIVMPLIVSLCRLLLELLIIFAVLFLPCAKPFVSPIQ